MANVFNTNEKVVQRFDIKGSWQGRSNTDPHPNSTKKDNDFKKRSPIYLKPMERYHLLKATKEDVKFF